MIAGPSLYYFFLLNAYDEVIDGDVVEVRALDINENIYFDRNVEIAVEGGYDQGFSTVTKISIIKGNMTISDGTVMLENVCLQLSSQK